MTLNKELVTPPFCPLLSLLYLFSTLNHASVYSIDSPINWVDESFPLFKPPAVKKNTVSPSRVILLAAELTSCKMTISAKQCKLDGLYAQRRVAGSK